MYYTTYKCKFIYIFQDVVMKKNIFIRSLIASSKLLVYTTKNDNI